MLVIHYEPHDGDVVPDGLVDQYVRETIDKYRSLPPTEDDIPSILRIYIGSTLLMAAFVKAIEREELHTKECMIVMGRRQVYFLFLKNLFSESSVVSHTQLAVIFQNSNSSFVALL